MSGTPVTSATYLAPAATLPRDLRYVDDRVPGFTRRRRGESFQYLDRDGKTIRDEKTLARIRALAIPPAYEKVWICPDPCGHLQASGRDARGRKQYRYHARWRETRDATKYDRLQAFAAALPRIRARVKRDLALPGLPRDKVLATVIRLLDTTLIRIGNATYARDNKSFGLTTLRVRHVSLDHGALRFQFRGKSGVEHDVPVTDAKIARIIKRCMELPGHHLFQYKDADGERHAVDSSAINDYLHACTRERSPASAVTDGADDAVGATCAPDAPDSPASFTAKDYRTWAGSVLALSALRDAARSPDGTEVSKTESHRRLVAAVKSIAARLGNTAAVCRKCYIHPSVVDAYESGELACAADCAVPAGHKPLLSSSQLRSLRKDERDFAAFLILRTAGETAADPRQSKRVTSSNRPRRAATASAATSTVAAAA